MKTALSLIIGAALLCLFIIFFLATAHAEVYMTHTLNCDEAKVFEKELTEKYHEHQIAGGIDGRGSLVRVFASEHTWTITRTSPNGLACIFDAGSDWETLKPEIDGRKT